MSDLFSYSWHPQHLSPHRRQRVLAYQHGDARLGMPVPSSSSPIALLIYIKKISSIWCLIPQRFGAVSEILSHCLNQPLCVLPACESRSNLILSRQESQVHSEWGIRRCEDSGFRTKDSAHRFTRPVGNALAHWVLDPGFIAEKSASEWILRPSQYWSETLGEEPFTHASQVSELETSWCGGRRKKMREVVL